MGTTALPALAADQMLPDANSSVTRSIGDRPAFFVPPFSNASGARLQKKNLLISPPLEFAGDPRQEPER